jgi:hypothetical protein
MMRGIRFRRASPSALRGRDELSRSDAMTDPGGGAVSDPMVAIVAGLASSNLEEVHDAIIDIGKHGRRELVARVVPYLTSATALLREAALRTLVFHLHLEDHRADAMRMLAGDPDEGVREAAAMGLGCFATRDRALLELLVEVALDQFEQDTVRAAALLAALDAAGIGPAEFPRERALPDFETRADWALLATVLHRAGFEIAPALAVRLVSRPAHVPLTGEAARAFTRVIAERNRKLRAERLAAAKADAAMRGKEPFDLAKLETMSDTTHAGRLDPFEERHAEFEEMYYTWYPRVMTIVEFAAKVDEWNRWS